MPSPPPSTPETNDWSYIPFSQFSAPSEPTTEAVRSGVRALWARIRPWSTARDSEAEIDPPQLQSAPRDLLDRLLPAPDWPLRAHAALEHALQPWLHSQELGSTCQMVICAPYSNGDKIIQDWAREHDLRMIQPPTYEQIVANDTSWLAQWGEASDTRLVFPNLERAYLRHYNGLALIRALLDQIWRCGHACVIGCQSWAWAFLENTCPTNQANMQTWTLAPLDSDRLVAWILDELSSTDLARRVTFRRAENGKLAIDLQPEGQSTMSTRTLFDQISAHSRGDPALAWSLWRHSLSIATDEDVKEEAQREAKQDDRLTIWVRSWDSLKLPSVPPNLASDDSLILHTILLHDGLPEDVLRALLPGPAPVLSRTLSRLNGAGMITLAGDGLWRVHEFAYPSVRQHLNREGFLVDAL